MDLVLLSDLMVDHLGIDDLGSLCFALGVDETALGTGGMRNRFEALIEEMQRRGRLTVLVDNCRRIRPDGKWDQLKDNDADARNFPFTNRESEIDLIMYDIPSHRIIQAPMGYGKTALCEVIRSRFQQPSWREQWVCRYVNIEPSTFDLLDEINAAERQLDQETPNGLVVIYDLGHHQFQSIFDKGKIEILAGFEDRLRDYGQRFRIIITGRRFTTDAYQSLKQLKNYSQIKLTPFDHDVITRSIVDYLKLLKKKSVTINADKMRQVAAHFLFLTAGHPGCLAELIRQYGDIKHISGDEFVEANYDDILVKIVSPTIDAIFDEITQDLTDDVVKRFLEINVLRYTYYPILDKLIQAHDLQGIPHSTMLADKLTMAQLYEWNGGFLEDGIFQKLAVIRLWYREPDNFRRYGQIARRICKSYLKEPTCQRPALWATEYLYQVLQAYSPRIRDSKVRSLLCERFFGHYVPGITNVLLAGRNRQESLRDLLNYIKEDKTFRFTINYYLRESQFSNEPFERLLNLLEDLMREDHVEN